MCLCVCVSEGHMSAGAHSCRKMALDLLQFEFSDLGARNRTLVKGQQVLPTAELFWVNSCLLPSLAGLRGSVPSSPFKITSYHYSFPSAAPCALASESFLGNQAPASEGAPLKKLPSFSFFF